jgi:hypothetical protein
MIFRRFNTVERRRPGAEDAHYCKHREPQTLLEGDSAAECSEHAGVAAYNWGLSNVDTWIKAGRPPEKLLAGVRSDEPTWHSCTDATRTGLTLATFRRKKPFLDDRATDLGARTRRQIAAGKV